MNPWLTGFPANIGKQESPHIIPSFEYKCQADIARLGFYNLEGELLDILPQRQTYNPEGVEITKNLLEREITVVIDLKDPEIYEYLRELKEIQQVPIHRTTRRNWTMSPILHTC